MGHHSSSVDASLSSLSSACICKSAPVTEVGKGEESGPLTAGWVPDFVIHMAKLEIGDSSTDPSNPPSLPGKPEACILPLIQHGYGDI